MELSQLTNLIRDVNQNNLYNLMVFDFKSNVSLNIRTYYVEEINEMRIDNICYDIYETVDGVVDIILNLNDIDNPLNIKKGDLIYYCEYDQLALLETDDVLSDIQTGNFFLNPSKSSKQDANRASYIDNNYQLSPTQNGTSISAVNMDGNRVKISS